MSSPEEPKDLDQVTSRRLSKLRSMPVDTSRLDAMLEMQIPRPASNRVEGFFRLRAVRAVAACIGIAAIIGLIVWGLSGGSVLASPEVMAQFHEDLVSGKVPAMQVDSISNANKALADELNMGIQIPQVPADHVMMCCMRTIKDKHVACVLLHSDGVPVTMVVANAMDMRVPESERRIEKGTEYHITTSGKLHMVMMERRGRWICLISELPVDRLVEVADAIEL